MVSEASNPERLLPWLAAVLHLKHAAVGVGAEHLSTEETQHGRLTVITIHHMVGTPAEEERGNEGGREGSQFKETLVSGLFSLESRCFVDQFSEVFREVDD